MAEESSPYQKYIRNFWKLYLAVAVVILFLFFLIANGVLGFMPSFEDLENTETVLASEVISDDDKVLGTFFLENRTFVSYENLPPRFSPGVDRN